MIKLSAKIIISKNVKKHIPPVNIWTIGWYDTSKNLSESFIVKIDIQILIEFIKIVSGNDKKKNATNDKMDKINELNLPLKTQNIDANSTAKKVVPEQAEFIITQSFFPISSIAWLFEITGAFKSKNEAANLAALCAKRKVTFVENVFVKPKAETTSIVLNKNNILPRSSACISTP